MIAILLALGNAFSGALGNVVGAMATRLSPTFRVLAVSAASALIASIVVGTLFGATAPMESLVLGFVAGVVGAAGLPLCYRAFALGPVGVVSPVLAGTSTITVVVVAWIASGAMAATTLLGLVLCIAAVVIASFDKSAVSRQSLIFAVGAGLSFGTFALIMSRAPGGDGLWPLVSARVGVFTVALLALGITELRGRRRSPDRQNVRGPWVLVAAASGLAEILANVLFLLALVTGDLATVSVVQALSPVAAVLVGWALLHQRPRRRHWVAVLVAVTALLVISLV